MGLVMKAPVYLDYIRMWLSIGELFGSVSNCAQVVIMKLEYLNMDAFSPLRALHRTQASFEATHARV